MKPSSKHREGSARLSGWDYRNQARYFITICTKNRFHFLGQCFDGIMSLSDIGKMTYTFWKEIPNHFSNVFLDVFQVMPNHIHGIIALTGEIIAPRNTNLTNRNIIDKPVEKNQYFQAISPKAGSLATIVRSYKSVCKKEINLNFPDAEFAWQPRYHDYIIRDDEKFFRIKNYIINNPKNWKKDKFFG